MEQDHDPETTDSTPPAAGLPAGGCPDRASFNDLVAGRLSADRHAVIEAHIVGCEVCQHLLETLDESESFSGKAGDWLTELRHAARELPPIYRQAVERLKAGGEIGSRMFPRSRSGSGVMPADLIGDYRIIREIGRGGMGFVYEAEQLSLRKRVALKILPFASLLDSKRLARFENEARMAANLEHPHIVPVYAFGVDRGVHYYAMRYVDGQNLAQVLAGIRQRSASNEHVKRQVEASVVEAATTVNLQQGATVANSAGFSEGFADATVTDSSYLRKVVGLVISAAEALAHAHDQGIVHRDVKPSNLMLDRDGHLWVADFGLARIATETATSTSGALLGTVPYMSPEQVNSSLGVVDQRSDVYSLGATLYELTTLAPPFGDAPVPTLLNRIVSEDPRPLQSLNRRIPRDLQTVILKALSKEPAERYATARDFAADLRRFLESKPTLAKPPRLADRIARWMRKHPSTVAAVGSVLALLMMLSGLLILLNARLGDSLDEQRELNERLNDAVSEARAHASTAQDQLYAADMQLAADSFHNSDLAATLALLERNRPQPGEPDSRGPEWYWLQGQVSAHGGTIQVSHLPLHRARLSPDRRWLAVAGADSRIRLFDAESWQPVGEWSTDQEEINDIQFNMDSTRIAAIGTDGTLSLWDVAARRQLFRVSAHSKRGVEVTFHQQDRQLVTWGNDEVIRIWDATNGELLREIRGAWSEIASLRVSPDGETFAVGGFSEIHLLAARDGSPRRILHGHEGRVLAQLFPSGRDELVSAGVDGTIRLWNLRDGTHVIVGRHLDGVQALTLLPGGGQVAAGDRSGTIRTWDVRHPQVAELDVVNSDFTPDVRWDIAEEGNVRWCGMTPDAKILFAATNRQLLARDVEAGEIREIPLVDPSVLHPSPPDPTGSQLGDVSRDGQRLALIDGIYRQNSATPSGWELQCRIPRPADQIHAIQFSPDGQRIALGNQMGRVWIHDTLTGKPLTMFEDPARDIPGAYAASTDDCVSALAFSGDGRWLAAESGPNTPSHINVWDMQLGQFSFSMASPPLPHVKSVAFCPDNDRIVSCALDMKIRVWSVRTQHHLIDWTVHQPSIGLDVVAVSPDGRWLASADLSPASPHLRLWDMATRKVVWAVHQKFGKVQFSANSEKLLAGGYGSTACLWDITRILASASASDRARPQDHWPEVTLAHDGRIQSMTVSADGTRLVSVGKDGRMRTHGSSKVSRDPSRLLPETGAAIDGIMVSAVGDVLLWEQNKAAWLCRAGESLAMRLPIPPLPLREAAIDVDGSRIAVINEQGKVVVSTGPDDLAPKTISLSMSPDEFADWCGFVPGQSRLAVRVRSGTHQLLIVDLKSGQIVERIATASVTHCDVAQQGSRIAFGDGRIALVWNSALASNPQRLVGHREGVTALAIAADDREVASAGGERAIILWDVETSQPRKTLLGHRSRIEALAFSPDGRTLASTDHDGVIKFWHVATGRQLLELPQNLSIPLQIAFSADPAQLLCLCRNGEVVVYRFDVPE